MIPLRQRLDILSIVGGEPLAAAVAEALPWAAAEELPELARAACLHGGRSVLAALLMRWEDLDESIASAVVALSADLSAPFRDAMQRRPRSVPALAGLAVRRGDWRLAGPLAEAAAGGMDRVVGPALLAVTRAAVGRDGRGRPGRAVVLTLDEAIDQAVRLRDGTRPDASIGLAVAVLATRPGPRLDAALDDGAHPLTITLRRMAARSQDPELARLALRWVGDARLQGLGLRTLARTSGDQAWEAVLSSAHLLAAARRRRPMRSIHRGLQCLPAPEVAAQLLPTAQRGFVRLVEQVPLSRQARRRMLEGGVRLSCTAARLRAADLVPEHDRSGGLDVLEPLLRDTSPAIARRAAHHLLGPASARHALASVEASPHPRVAGRARGRAARAHASAFFARWLALGLPPRRAAAAIVERDDALDFRVELRRALGATELRERAAAIDLVRRLRLAADCVEALAARLGDTDPRIVASAVTLLAGVPGAPRAGIVAALDHANPRVRANAVEALGADCGARLATIVRAGSGRERANAVRIVAGVDADTATAAVVEMVTCPDAAERLRGLWAARRLRTEPARAAIARAAKEDPAPIVRARARITHLLLGEPA